MKHTYRAWANAGSYWVALYRGDQMVEIASYGSAAARGLMVLYYRLRYRATPR